MINVMTIIINQKESEILTLFLKNFGLSVSKAQPDYPGYTKVMQYKPSVIIMELPDKYLDQSHFLALIKKNQSTTNIPVIGYGNMSPGSEVNAFCKNGVSVYYQRPLQTKRIIEDIKKIAQSQGKDIEPAQDEYGDDDEFDLDYLLLPTTTNGERLEMLVNQIGKLMAFPFTLTRVLQVTQSGTTGAADLAKAIKADPVVATNVLKVANSPLFASRGKQISSIKDAIIRVGFKETKNITMSISVMQLFDPEEKSIGFDRIEFWYHSLAVGVIAEKLAKNAGYPNPEMAFIAGLMHDFGMILFDEFFKDLFADIIEETTRVCGCFIDVASDYLGINHNDVVASMFEKWRIPDDIIAVILKQNDFLDLIDQGNPGQNQLIVCVGLANIIAKTIRFGSDCDAYVRPVEDSFLRDLKYGVGLQKGFFDDVLARINMFCQFLKLEKKDFAMKCGEEPSENAPPIVFFRPCAKLFDSFEISLKCKGAALVSANSPADIAKMESPPKLIIIEPGPEMPLDEVMAWATVPRPNDLREGQTVPIILLQNEKERKYDFAQLSRAIQLPLSVDLRVLDYIVDSFINDREVQYPIVDLSAATETLVQKKELEITLRPFDGVDKTKLIMDIKGAVRLADIGDLRKCFQGVLQNENTYLIINFKNLSLMDSILIGLLANFHKKMEQGNSKLLFLGVEGHTLETLEITGVSNYITLFNDETELAQYFAQNA